MKKISNFTKYLKVILKSVIMFFIYSLRCHLVLKKEYINEIYIYVTEEQRNWILGAIARELKNTSDRTVKIGNDIIEASKSDVILFMHYKTAFQQICGKPKLLRKEIIIWYTHPSAWEDLDRKYYHYLFKTCRFVMVSCTLFKKKLAKNFSGCNFVFNEYGANPDLFYFRKRTKKSCSVVGISSNFYYRKNPSLILKIIESNPDLHFLIVGTGWDAYPRLQSCNNVEFRKLNYEQYPDFYAEIDCLLSCAFMEGGPIGVVEALASGTPVLASKTGIAEDIIQFGINGYIFSTSDDLDQISDLLRNTLNLGCNSAISSSVKDYTWKNLATSIDANWRKTHESLHTY